MSENSSTHPPAALVRCPISLLQGLLPLLCCKMCRMKTVQERGLLHSTLGSPNAVFGYEKINPKLKVLRAAAAIVQKQPWDLCLMLYALAGSLTSGGS